MSGLRWLPRSVRGRLVATYTVAALLLAAVGGLIFTTQLSSGLQASLDASLDLQAASVAAALAEPGSPDLGSRPLPPLGPASPLRSLTLVFTPSGQLAVSQPQRLPSLLTPADLTAARGGRVRLTRTVSGGAVRLVLVPVRRVDGVWIVAAGAGVELVESASDEVDRGLLIAAPLLLIAVGLGAWLLSGAALRPVERMRAEAADLGSHDAAGRIGVPGTADELASLAVTLNELLDRLHASVERQRELVADAGHELRTPLAVLRVELELADRPGRSRADLADAVGHARAEVERLSRLASDLLFLARADGTAALVTLEGQDLALILAESGRAWRAGDRDRGVSVRVHPPGRIHVLADASALRRAVDNLIANAVAASPPGGAVDVRAHVRAATTPVVQVLVTDSGPGFPREFLPHALERFRRADVSRTTAGGGSGLGLAISAEIAVAHGGRLEVANRPGGGAAATLTLPLMRDDEPPAR